MKVSEMLLKCFDCIFPPSEHTRKVRNTTPHDMIGRFVLQQIDGIHALSHYSDGTIRALIHEAKFHGNTQAYSLLNVLFTQYINMHHDSIDVIIPIPLSPSRMRTRGYNQVYEILRASQHSTTIPIETKALKRVMHTRPQTELPRNDRLTNVQNAFRVLDGKKTKGKRILIVDDVMTTGATLRAAKAALLLHSPTSVTMLALTH